MRICSSGFISYEFLTYLDRLDVNVYFIGQILVLLKWEDFWICSS